MLQEKNGITKLSGLSLIALLPNTELTNILLYKLHVKQLLFLASWLNFYLHSNNLKHKQKIIHEHKTMERRQFNSYQETNTQEANENDKSMLSQQLKFHFDSKLAHLYIVNYAVAGSYHAKAVNVGRNPSAVTKQVTIAGRALFMPKEFHI